MFEFIGGLLGGGNDTPPTVAVSNLREALPYAGDKWDGSFGPTELLTLDYYELRRRSLQLFRSNHYARGLLRRLRTNEINTGLHLESDPLERMLGLREDALAEWTEDVENRFSVYGKNPLVCDDLEQRSFGELQAAAWIDSKLGGDVLAVLVQHRLTSLPRVRLVAGENVQTPMPAPPLRKGHEIRHGVELDPRGRQVAYWVRQVDDSIKRMPAWGEKSGRRIAWLIYGTERRYGEVRGEPFLALMLHALRDLDRYRDATLRKAVINSIVALFVTRSAPTTGASIGAGVTRKGAPAAAEESADRTLRIANYLPGLIVDELNEGEDIKAGPQGGTDQAFGEFEAAIVASMAWANEVPPEILTLAFSNNYSASQAAINEFKMYLDPARQRFGEAFCQPVYESWLLSEVLLGHVEAPGLLEAWGDRRRWATYGAWVNSDWTGHVKPSTDLFKATRGYEGAVSMGAMTLDRVARNISGTKFSRNIKKLSREIQALEAAGLAASFLPPSRGNATGGGSGPADEAPVHAPDEDDQEDDDQ